MTQYFLEANRTLLSPQMLDFDSLRLLGRGSMQLGAVDSGMVSTHTAVSSLHAGTLHGKRLAHNRAATTEHLEVGHGARSRRRCGGERAEGGGRALGEERAHGPRLMEKSLHAGQWQSSVKGKSVRGRGCVRLWVEVREGGECGPERCWRLTEYQFICAQQASESNAKG
jgi:hypothetical protein